MTNQTREIISQGTLSGTIQSGCILLGVAEGINLNSIADQPIGLVGGSAYIVTDIVVTNVSNPPVAADNGQWWQLPSKGGVQIAQTEFSSPCFSIFNSPSLFGSSINVAGATFLTLYYNQGSGLVANTVSSPIYFSLGTAEGTPLTCDMYVYGYILY